MSRRLARRYLRALRDSPRMRRDLLAFGPKRALALEVAREETVSELHLLGFAPAYAREFVERFSDSLTRQARTPLRIHNLTHLAQKGYFDPPGFFDPEERSA